MAMLPGPTVGSQLEKIHDLKSIFGTLIHLQATGMNLKRECLQCHSGSSVVTD